MKPSRSPHKRSLFSVAILSFGIAILNPCLIHAATAPNIVLWDTMSPLGDEKLLEDRSGWQAVPKDILTLEADPAKARSDPGYYGREYSLKGDAVVENRHLTAVFMSTKGKVLIYSRDAEGESKTQIRKIAELSPLQGNSQPAAISHYKLLRHAGDEAALELSFSGTGSSSGAAVFVFDKTGIIEVRPGQNLKGLTVSSPIERAIVPDFIGDDLIFGRKDFSSTNTICLPSENLLLGLLKGEESELVMTWPKGHQRVQLRAGNESDAGGLIQSIDIESDGQSLYIAGLSAPGIWHQEPLSASQLEKDVMIQWKKPFPAKWKTQLFEEGTRTTFAFRESKGTVWRGVPGSYNYPAWFNGDEAFFRLSKKVPPKGDSVIYFVEGRETPASVPTPVDLLKATLGRSAAASILDISGRQLRTHHRRGGDGVHRACTCGCTEAIQALFEAGDEVTKKEHVKEDVEDMMFFVERHLERIAEYQHLAAEMLKFLQAKASSSPELKPFLDPLEEITKQIPEQYELQKENMKSLNHAHDLAQQTLALCSKKEPNNLKAYMDLLKAWRAMGGAQDYVVAQCHMITRRLSQEAGYGCMHQPQAVELAEEIRKRCRQGLRSPDGYEIWADY